MHSRLLDLCVVSVWAVSLTLASPVARAESEGSSTSSAGAEPGASGGRESSFDSSGNLVRAERRGMGGRQMILVFSPKEAAARDAIEAAFAEMDRFERLFSEWESESDISRLNRAAGGDPVQVSEYTVELLKRGLFVSEKSHGAFSLTWAALASLWDFSKDVEVRTLPGDVRLLERLSQVDDSHLIIDEQARTAKLAKAGMAVGVGAIGKGFAIERALDALAERGFANVLVFAGGDIAARGKKGDTPWFVGIQDPRADGYFAVVALENQAIATAGDYQEFVIVEGERYHHILDPRTGKPAKGCRSASVMALNATTADALATAVFVLGEEEGMQLVGQLDNTEAVIVTSEGQVVVSPGLEGRLRLVRPPTRDKNNSSDSEPADRDSEPPAPDENNPSESKPADRDSEPPAPDENNPSDSEPADRDSEPPAPDENNPSESKPADRD